MSAASQTTLDIPYPSGFYSFQTPVLLDYVAAINGVAPSVPLGAPFTYLDLGCGDGFTIVLLAASYPDCRFIGVDLNPEHIAIGAALARAGGLDNVRLIEGDFEAWRGLDLPECDYIAMHGVYAWISEAARDAVRDLLAARLRPGGLAYVSYNAFPGWASVAPLRQFLLDYTRGMPGDPLHNIAATIRHLQDLRAKGAAYFKDNPSASGMLDDLAKKDIRYVAHEIYVPHWSPQPFSAVSRQMRAAGLDFVGSAALAGNYARPSVKAEFLPLLMKETNRERAELHRDTVNNTFFRRDVFAKMAPETPRLDVMKLLEAFPFGTTVPLEGLRRSIALPDGEMPLDAEPFEGLRRAIANGAKRIPELRALPAFGSLRPDAVENALQMMAVGSQIVPFARASASATAAADWDIPLPLNRRLIAEPVGVDPFVLLVAPALGSVTVVPSDEALVLLAVAEARADADAWAWDYAVRRKAWLRDKGVAATAPAKHAAAFARTQQILSHRLPKLVELGVITPR
jgi:SAM-dependent methyltransferase